MDPEPFFSLILLAGLFKPFSFGALISFIIVLILLLFSALISGSEVAFFSLNPSEKEELNNSETKEHRKVSELLAYPKKLLATILISNNFINVAIIILSTYTINNIFDFTDVPIWINLVIQVAGITFVLLLFGEVIPKVYATKNALTLAKTMANPIVLLKKIFKPISSLLIYSTGIIDKKVKKKGLDVSVEELSEALDLTEDIPENKDEHRILKGIVKFGETSVKQVMKARVDVVTIEKKIPFNEVVKKILACGHSRIPIYEESFDKIAGLLYIKDLLPYIKEADNFNWNSLIRKPFYVPENKKLDDLLKEFQEKKIHLAIVVDEYGGTSGIITLEDVLEEIVGEISDEFDADDISYSKLDENTYIFEGKTSLNDIFKIIELKDNTIFDDVRKDADTLAGLVIEIAGKIPLKNEKIMYQHFTFIVEAADTRRVKRVKLLIGDTEEE
ncbi:MAG: gliding motility-associated protein GldE [Flavobacteriales bacterium]|nr:gliding motility-associated protein GldE [Flavobacteriales bacterium]